MGLTTLYHPTGVFMALHVILRLPGTAQYSDFQFDSRTSTQSSTSKRQ